MQLWRVSLKIQCSQVSPVGRVNTSYEYEAPYEVPFQSALRHLRE